MQRTVNSINARGSANGTSSEGSSSGVALMQFSKGTEPARPHIGKLTCFATGPVFRLTLSSRSISKLKSPKMNTEQEMGGCMT
eukprot:1047550-Heterocapsa_arctica.AAC.1